MGDASVNGEVPHSSTLSHLNSYPFVSDSVTTFKNNHYGRKSIDLTNAAYVKILKPTFPYFETPANYAKPYVAKADEFGDKFLSKFDEKVPLVKSETKEIKDTVTTYAHWPLVQANKTKDWILSTYSEERKKVGGEGYVANGKAVITSSLVLTSETLNWLSGLLATKKEQAKGLANDAKEKATQ